jgi:hypothetical protein
MGPIRDQNCGLPHVRHLGRSTEKTNLTEQAGLDVKRDPHSDTADIWVALEARSSTVGRVHEADFALERCGTAEVIRCALDVGVCF